MKKLTFIRNDATVVAKDVNFLNDINVGSVVMLEHRLWRVTDIVEVPDLETGYLVVTSFIAGADTEEDITCTSELSCYVDRLAGTYGHIVIENIGDDAAEQVSIRDLDGVCANTDIGMLLPGDSDVIPLLGPYDAPTANITLYWSGNGVDFESEHELKLR